MLEPKDHTRPIVLVVEDRPSHAKLFVEMLKAFGHETAVALTGRDGLAMAQFVKPSLIVVDIRLPDLDGRQVIAELRKQPATQSVPIMAISAADEPNLVEDCADAGADMFLYKPVRLHQFTQSVASLLNKLPDRPQDI